MSSQTRPRLASRNAIFARPAAAILVFALTVSNVLAKDAGPTTVEGTVTIEGTVDVAGSVEVLNDSLNQPFVVTANTGATVTDSPSVKFDIPDGKRLVVEFIAVQASMATGDTNRLFFQPTVGNTTMLVPLPVQFQSVEGAVTYMISAIPFKMRIDGVPGRPDEIIIRRGVGSNGTITATLSGYLVDL